MNFEQSLECVQQEIKLMVKLMDDRGGTLLEYLKRFGEPTDEFCFGKGGNVIYKSDNDRLASLQKARNELLKQRKAEQKKVNDERIANRKPKERLDDIEKILKRLGSSLDYRATWGHSPWRKLQDTCELIVELLGEEEKDGVKK